MSFIFEVLNFFDATKNSWKVLGILMAVIPSAGVISMFTPQFLMTYRTKNTTGLNKLMFSLNMVATFLFAVAAACLCAEQIAGDKAWHLITITSIFTCLNVYTCLLSAYMIYTKIINENKAKSLGLTEVEYYKQHIEQ